MATQEIKKLIAQEYIKCAKDPAYFMRRFCYIQHPVRGRILFNLYPFQEEVLHLFRDSKNIIVLKSRQLGISTLGAGYSLWLMLFHKDKNVLCLATTQATARNLVAKVIFMYEQLPVWLKVPTIQKNKLSMWLKNGSKITAKSSNTDAARSEAVSLLLVDECLVGSQTITALVGDKEPEDISLESLFFLGKPLDVDQVGEVYGPDVEIRKLTDVQVLTPDSYKPVSKIKRVRADGYFKVPLSNTEEIRGSGSHKILCNDGHFHYFNTLSRGMKLQGDVEVVEDPIWVEEEVYLYDLMDVEGNVYITTNGVVNHNCAFIDNIEETFAAAQQTLATGGQAMLLSTPNGIGNFFHSTWTKAEMGENSFVPVRLPWQVHPERDQAWRDQQDADLGPRFASQECDCDFLASGDTVLEPEDMSFYEETYQTDPVERRGLDGNLWIWEYPDYSKSYMISADVARGDGSDYSAFHVWDIENCTQIAEYKGKLSPRDYGAVLCGVASEYNNALLVCENANVGWSTIEEIIHRGYPNLYYGDDSTQDTAESYASKLDHGRLTPGFTTSPKTRPLIIAKLVDYIHQKSVIIRSKRTLLELRTFIWKNGKAQAADKYHDDLVMSCGIGLYVRDTALRLRQQGLDLSRAQMGAFSNMNRREDTSVVKTTYAPNPYQVQDMHGHTQDISWVLR